MITTLLVTSSVLTMGTMASKFDDLAMAPSMGWNSWNLFEKDITEKDVIEIAEAMVNTGMAEIGYEVCKEEFETGRGAVDRRGEGDIYKKHRCRGKTNLIFKGRQYY
jgi:hypothetical protein